MITTLESILHHKPAGTEWIKPMELWNMCLRYTGGDNEDEFKRRYRNASVFGRTLVALIDPLKMTDTNVERDYDATRGGYMWRVVRPTSKNGVH